MSEERRITRGPEPGKTRPALAFAAMLPVFVMLGWFLAHREEVRGRELEDARQILGMALDRVEYSISPTAPLESILTEEMSNKPASDPVRFEVLLRSALAQMIPEASDPSAVKINLFDNTGRPVSWPPDETPEAGAAIWNWIMATRTNSQQADDIHDRKRVDAATLASASAVVAEWFDSEVSPGILEGASYFDVTIEDRNHRSTAVALFMIGGRKRENTYKLGVIIRVPLCEIPPASYHAWAAISKPPEDDASGLGILDSTGRNWLVRSGRLPESIPSALLAQPDKVAAIPGGFAVQRDLPPHAGGKLVLFRAESIWTGGGTGFKLALAFLILVAAAASWLLADVLAGARIGSLRTRTALVFLFAGMVPIGFSVVQGAMRLRDLETVRRIEWQNEAERVMTSLDRGFRDTLERYQHRFSMLIREIAGKPEKKIADSRYISARCTEVINIEANDPADSKRQDFFIRTASSGPEERILARSPILINVIKDIYLEMRAAAGLGQTPKKEKLSLPLHELIGDAIPLGEIIGRLGHIEYATLSEKTALLFFKAYGLRKEPVAGLLMGGTTLGNDTGAYFTANMNSEEWKNRDWELFRIHNTVIKPYLPVVPREFFRLAVRTQQTGSSARARVDFPEAPYLVVTNRPRYLQMSALAARIPLDRMKSETAWLFALACAGVLIAIGMAVGVAVYLSRRLLEPIRMLRTAAESVGEGTLDIALDIHGKDELSSLGASFLEMTDGLRQRERMRRFLSESAWGGTESERAGETGGGYINAAVLCSDIRGFTSISEKQPPARVTAMLNEYFTAMDGVIRAFGGEIDKLIGDAIQAVFKTRPGSDHPAKRAVLAGLAMRKKLSDINAARSARGEFSIENGVGIHFGRMISGKVGAQGGRQDFTVIGSVVTGAAKLEAASKDGRYTKVILSASTAGLIGPEFICRALDTADFEGPRPFEVVDARFGYAEAVP